MGPKHKNAFHNDDMPSSFLPMVATDVVLGMCESLPAKRSSIGLILSLDTSAEITESASLTERVVCDFGAGSKALASLTSAPMDSEMMRLNS